MNHQKKHARHHSLFVVESHCCSFVVFLANHTRLGIHFLITPHLPSKQEQFNNLSIWRNFKGRNCTKEQLNAHTTVDQQISHQDKERIGHCGISRGTIILLLDFRSRNSIASSTSLFTRYGDILTTIGRCPYTLIVALWYSSSLSIVHFVLPQDPSISPIASISVWAVLFFDFCIYIHIHIHTKWLENQHYCPSWLQPQWRSLLAVSTVIVLKKLHVALVSYLLSKVW